MDDVTTVYGLSSTVCFAGVVKGLFESLLAESFGGG